MMPPWLWVWLIGDLAILIPAEVSDERYLFATYTGHGDVAPSLTAGTPYKLLFLFAVLAALTYAILAAGAIACIFPRLRGRWVEKRFRLSEDNREVIAEMRRFVGQYDPAIQLRVAIRGEQMARIYPVGWRGARIAVFLPLVALWHRDRLAAQAILLHEVAHHRHCDQLVVGLGSPFVWLIRIWVPAFIVLALAPILVYFALGGGLLAQVVTGQGALQLAQPAVLLILPVTALWLAELNADELTAGAVGPRALRDALRATALADASIPARLMALLSHPPRRLRLRLASPRPAGTITLLAAWPAVLIVQLAVVILAALTAYLLISDPLPQIGTDLLAGTHQFLLSTRILVAAEIVLLLLWPVLAGPWDRLWSSGQSLDKQLPGKLSGRQLVRLYLAAAIVPVAVLLGSFAPLPTAFPSDEQAAARNACAELAAWDRSGGFKVKERVDADLGNIEAAFTDNSAVGLVDNTKVLMADTAAALRNPPPGTGHGAYLAAMTDLRTYAADMLAGNAVAIPELETDEAAEIKATKLVLDQARKCTSGTGSPAGASPTASRTSAPMVGSGQLTIGELQARLLTASDLPPGYEPYVVPNSLPETSNKPACLTTLNDLTTTSPSSSPSMAQVGTAFADGLNGPQVVEILRSYPGHDAVQAFTALTNTLAGCGTFTLGWTTPAATGVESVRPLGSVNLGSQSWSAAITVKTTLTVTGRLVLVRVGSSLVALQMVAVGGLPPAVQPRAVAALAAAKLTH